MSKEHHFTDKPNPVLRWRLAQISAITPTVFRQVNNNDAYLTPQEKKMYIVMSDIAKSNGWDSRTNISPAFAKEVMVKMATRTYRVQFAGNGRVSVSSWGLAKDVQDSYDCVDALPHWMQRKIAVLMIFDPEKPMEEIKGIGRRISRGTFWVFPDEGEDDGDDTRTPCESTGT